jgi:hypothetical protein
MKSTMINRCWPAEEDAESLAVQLQLDTELNRTQAARDLQRSLHDLEFTAELSGLSQRSHQQLTMAIAALRAAVNDQWQAVRG